MENTSLYRLATKALKEISQSEENLFFNVFKDYLKDKKMFFGHFTNLDFYFFFFYCYFMWRAKRVLSFEEVNGLMNNVEMAELIYTSFDEVEETCSECEGDGEEECPNCDGEKYVSAQSVMELVWKEMRNAINVREQDDSNVVFAMGMVV